MQSALYWLPWLYSVATVRYPPVGLDEVMELPSVLVLQGKCRVDTWENPTAKRIAIVRQYSPIRVANALQ